MQLFCIVQNQAYFQRFLEISVNPRSVMDSTGFSASTSVATSTSVSGANLDRPEAEIDRPETVLPTRPTGKVLRSQTYAGRSKVVVISAEIHPERSVVAPRPEPEIARPEVEFTPVACPSSDPPP